LKKLFCKRDCFFLIFQMTKHTKANAKSTGRPKTFARTSQRMTGIKVSPRSKPRFKQQSWSQNNGRWNGNNGRNQGSYGLSYEFSQQNRPTQASNNFSSFFAPTGNKFEQAKIVELGLLIRKHWVGGLIGKKGKTIWMIRDKSNGANIDFGNDDLIVDRSKDKKWEQSPWPGMKQEKYCVCAVSGSKQQATDAVLAIAEQVAKGAQSSDYRLEFLIPEEYVGAFIGKKGANLKQMKGPAGNGVSINVRDDPITLGSNKVTLCTLFGPAEEMGNTIERAAKWLGDISIRVQMDREAGQA